MPPSKYILVTNLGNQTRLDWEGLFDNVFNLYPFCYFIFTFVLSCLLLHSRRGVGIKEGRRRERETRKRRRAVGYCLVLFDNE